MALDPKGVDAKKLDIINHVDGPLLVIAGPGAGKTMAIVERVVHLIGVCKIAPESILVSTFTEKAAKELLSRISRRLLEEGINVSPNEMYIGTMHSIFLRILKDNAEFSRLKKNYRTFDDFDQTYAVYRNMYNVFNKIENINLVTSVTSNWNKAQDICRYVNKVREEAISIPDLQSSLQPEMKALGEVCAAYEKILESENAVDFSAMQTETLKLIESQPAVLESIKAKIRYLIIDEYQDTNTIQEMILLKLAGEQANICVVGDEDQSIYRFRGASVRNILQFADNFPPGVCKTVVLDTNYRSHSEIVNFYNKWMNGCEWVENGKRFRYDKTIKPRPGVKFDECPAVVRVTGSDAEEWRKNVLSFIKRLQKEKVVTDLNQIAFLFHSVRNPKVVALCDYLESNGIAVFSPRSAQFFEQDVTRLSIGLLFFLFPQAHEIIRAQAEHIPETVDYYVQCEKFLSKKLKEDMQGNADLIKWARRLARTHMFLDRPTDYTFLSLFYEAFRFPLFSQYLTTDHDGSPRTSRDSFNLALFSQLIAKFEHTYSINVLSPKFLESNLRHLFGQFLHFLHRGGLEEFEDYEETLPSGCVSVMTIHQSKGLEFPIVCVGSLGRNPRKNYTEIDEMLEKQFYHRPPFEPLESIKRFDFWREYYVAFSRPQNLLVVTGELDKNGRMGKTFDDITTDLLDWRDRAFVPTKLHLEKIKKSSIQSDYAFTSDILLYENCPTQYMALRYLGFAPHRQAATMFGSLVHQTIEDVHKCSLRGEEISEGKLEGWFNANYNSLSLSMKTYLDSVRREAALNQVKRYYERNAQQFGNLVAAEYDVSIPANGYILRGVIDLVRGQGDTVEIVDFKTDRKPGVNNPDDMKRLSNYHRQLEVYAHIVEKKFGKKVSRLHLYYTRADSESPYVSWDYAEQSVQKTMQTFDDIVGRIEARQFSNDGVRKCTQLCDNCDMRFYCHYK